MKSIMIVEDNEGDHFLNEIILKKVVDDIEIHRAYDGSEALEKLKKYNTSIDIVLLDINMPGMNGHEFLEEFTKIYTNNIPIVVMLTSSNQMEDKRKALGHDCVKAYLTKPLMKENVTKLQHIVKEQLNEIDKS